MPRKLISKRFTSYEQVHYNRTHQDLSHGVSFTCNAGDLVPYDIYEICPGDTFDIGNEDFSRLQTLLSPIFDTLFCDMYYFFVPHRLVWKHFVNFMGENDSTFWTEESTYSVPQVSSPDGGWNVGTIADYLGVPPKISNVPVSALPFRAYCKIVNDWFRDENLQTPCNFSDDDTDIEGSNGDDYVLDCVKGGKPFVANKYHDYFSSALPQPQKGDPVTLPVSGTAPLSISDTVYPFGNYSGSDPVRLPYIGTGASDSGILGYSPVLGVRALGVSANAFSVGNVANQTNLVADLSTVSAVNINDLRMAFAVQRLLEKDARGGTRYIEILKSHFGVDSDDARLQRSEYLGGKRFQVKINPIYQTSETSDNSPLGETGAISATLKSFHAFNKSFTEHGYVIALCCFRYPHTYAQGLSKLFSRKDRFDFYDPIFDHIGEQPILNKEIYLQGNEQDDEVFGYNEAWSDYRHMFNRVSGYMRPNVQGALSSWTIADNYDSLPKLDSSWIKEDKSNVDRVIYATSQITHQFLVDIYQRVDAYRVMSNHSIPRIVA